MAEFPTYEQIAKNVAEKALDEILYGGKSIREWMKIIGEQEPKADRVKTELNGVKTELEPCEDCISRQAVLDDLNDLLSDWDDDYNVPLLNAIGRVDDLPPVKPKEPKITDKTIQAILDFLENNNSEWGQIEWKDKNGKGFITDQGYFIEGLEELRDYLKESEVEE